MKPKSINNKPSITTNISNPPVIIKNKLQKSHKKKWLLISAYVLVFGISGVTTTILLLHNHANYSNSNFNPNSNSNLWEQYYENNKPDNKLINLIPTQDFFKGSANVVALQIKTVKDKDSLNFGVILNQIDKKLQDGNIETVSQNVPKSLPNNFFGNVINNPAVDFSVNNQQVTNSTFQCPNDYDQTTQYELKLTTSSEANAFGIENNNISFMIKITVTNLLTIDLKNVTLDDFTDKVIYTDSDSSSKATIPEITKYIQPMIKDAFVAKLKSMLKIKDIPDSDYEITFKDNDDKTIHDFNKDSVPVTFQVSSTTDKDNFIGTLTAVVNIKNVVFDISKEDQLQTTIANTYLPKEANHDKWLNIMFDNKVDLNDVDTCLTEAGLLTAKNKISETIKPLVISYFNEKCKTLNLKNDDIDIDSDLKVGDNLFQNDDGSLGHQSIITIKPKTEGYKLSGALPITITVHGTNSNATTTTDKSPDNFKLNGIYLPDKGDSDILQNGEHYYEQTALQAKWMGDDKDSLKSKFKNAYSIDENSFTGSFISQYKLEDKGEQEQITFNIADIKNSKIKNFYDLINKTKDVYLYTSVAKPTQANNNDRTLNNVQLVFTNDFDPPHANGNNVLYSFDIVNEKGISIANDATLLFPNFIFTISYQQKN